MKIFASTPAELKRLERGARYFTYLVPVLLAVLAFVEGRLVLGLIMAGCFGFLIALNRGRVPDRWLEPSSPAGNVLAIIMAAVLVAAIGLLWWALAHGA